MIWLKIRGRIIAQFLNFPTPWLLTQWTLLMAGIFDDTAADDPVAVHTDNDAGADLPHAMVAHTVDFFDGRYPNEADADVECGNGSFFLLEYTNISMVKYALPHIYIII